MASAGRPRVSVRIRQPGRARPGLGVATHTLRGRKSKSLDNTKKERK